MILHFQVQILFGLHNRKLEFSGNNSEPLHLPKDLHSLTGSSLCVSAGKKTDTPVKVSNGNGPCCRYVNVELCGKSPSGSKGGQATVLLENPHGDYVLTLEEVKQQVSLMTSILI